MTDKKHAGRMYLILVLLINVCLGTVYSWSVFRPSLEELFSVGSVASGLPYMVMLAMFSLTVPFAGRLQLRLGPRRTALLGGALLAAGWILSSLAPTVGALTFLWGGLGGIGVGTTYVVPLAIAHAWFPEKRGAATGLALAGFGMSPFVTAPLAELAIVAFGLRPTFWIVGLAFLVVVPGLGLILRHPAAGPTGSSTPTQGIRPREMLRRKEFYALWMTMLLGSLVGLGAIAITAPWAREVVGLSSGAAALAVSLLAVFNGVGRPVFGYLTDRLGLRTTALLSFGLIGIAAAALLLAPDDSVVIFALGFAVFWLLLGGWLAIAPAATARLFGPAHYAQNYGVVFQAYGLGAVVGTLFSGELHVIFGSYRAVLIPILGASAVGALISLLGFSRRTDTSG